MSNFVQVLSTGSALSAFNSTLYLATDAVRAFINVGDGIQRCAMEHKVKLAKINRIYLTRVDTDTVNGLPGLLLTLSASGNKRFTIYGPTGTAALLYATRMYIHRQIHEQLQYDIVEYNSDGDTHADSDLTVTPVILNTCKLNHSRTSNRLMDRFNVRTYNNAVDAAQTLVNYQQSSDNTATGSTVVSYILQLPTVLGKFDVQRALALGLKPGPIFRQLKAGLSVDVHIPATETEPERTLHVDPEQCVEPSHAGPVIAVIDVPQHGDVDTMVQTLTSHKAFKPYQTVAADAQSPHITIMLHMAATHIISRPAYQQWMQSFGTTTQHVTCNDQTRQDIALFRASTLHTMKLQYIHDSIFHMHQPTFDASVMAHITQQQNNNIRQAVPLMKYQLLPIASQGYDRSVELTSTQKSEAEAELHEFSADFSDILRQAHQANNDISTGTYKTFYDLTSPLPISTGDKFKSMPAKSLKPAAMFGAAARRTAASNNNNNNIDGTSDLHDYPTVSAETVREIFHTEPATPDTDFKPRADILQHLETCDSTPSLTFLGTGSAIPSKYRNVTAIYYHYNGLHMLMDCGEGTYGQLVRKYGQAQTDDIVINMDCIFISHLHADHHLGLIAVLQRRAHLLQQTGAQVKPMVLIAPPRLSLWIDEYAAVSHNATCEAHNIRQHNRHYGLMHNVQVFLCGDILDRQHAYSRVLADRLKLSCVRTVEALHCMDAYGLVIEDQSNYIKVVYSGDTMPNQALVNAGCYATVLIHESTFDSDMAYEAAAKRHSTMMSAIRVGHNMRANRIVLNHFSQRYPKLQSLDRNDPRTVTDKKLTGSGGSQRPYMSDLIVAFDMMRVEFQQLLWQPLLTPVLNSMFPMEEEVDDALTQSIEQGEAAALDGGVGKKAGRKKQKVKQATVAAG